MADEISATSAVSAAVIYPVGATVTRSAAFEMPGGGHEIVLRDMPMRFNADSLRVTGAGDAPFQVLSVDHSVERPVVDDPTNPEREAIKDEIDSLKDDVRGVEREKGPFLDQRRAAEARLEFIRALAEREPQNLVDETSRGANPASWRSAIEVIGEESQGALTALREAKEGLEDIDRRLSELRRDLHRLERKLANVAPPAPVSTLRVRVAADTAVSGDLSVSYRIENASWTPVYDLRLTQAAEGGEAAALRLERRASVSQTTSEDWDGVALTLSTARPSERMAAPRLDSLQARLRPPARPMARMRVGPASPSVAAGGGYRSNMLMAQRALGDDAVFGAADMAEAVMEPPAPTMATESAAFAQLRGQTLVFQIPETADVGGDGSAKQLFIGGHDAEAALLARSAPARDASAYLYARFENDSGGPVMAGEAAIFRDGAYVGQVALPFIPAGETKALPFGLIDGLTVERRTVDRTESQEAGVAPHMKRVETVVLSVRSTLGYDIPFTFFEAAPYSETDKVEATLTAAPKPTEADVEGARGVNAWTFELPAGESQTVSITTELRWPIGQGLIVD